MNFLPTVITLITQESSLTPTYSTSSIVVLAKKGSKVTKLYLNRSIDLMLLREERVQAKML